MLKRFSVLIFIIVAVLSSPLAQTTDSLRYRVDSSLVKIRLGDDFINITIYKYGDKSDLVFLNLHDNEYTSVTAAKKLLNEVGGVLIKINNDGERLIEFNKGNRTYRFDPNRIFSTAGINVTLKILSQATPAEMNELRYVSAAIIKLLPGNYKWLIGLHNNRDGEYSVESYLAGFERAREAKLINMVESLDSDDFFLTTSMAMYRYLKEEELNAVLENYLAMRDDGSLSLYCGRNHINYLNCETELDREETYYSMLRTAVRKMREVK